MPAWHAVRVLNGSYCFGTALDPSWAWRLGDLLYAPIRASEADNALPTPARTCQRFSCPMRAAECQGSAWGWQLFGIPNSGLSLQSDPRLTSRLM